MPPAQVQELVSQVKAWYEANKHNTRQRDLAEALGVSPTGLCQIFAGINQPSAATALKMIQFLEETKTMNPTNFLDPRTVSRQPAGNPGQPKTLHEAKEQLENLRLENAQLKAAALASPKPAFTVPAPTAKPKLAGDPGADPTYPTTGTPGADRPNKTPMPASPPPPTKSLPVTADTPYKIGEILKLENLDSLLLLLANPGHSTLQRGLIYQEVKARRNLEAKRFQ